MSLAAGGSKGRPADLFIRAITEGKGWMLASAFKLIGEYEP
jgi:hypothetical protein